MSIDTFGWLCSAVMLTGGYGVAHKRIWGLVAMNIGNVGWGYVGYLTGLWSLLGVSIAFAAMDCYAIYRWSRK